MKLRFDPQLSDLEIYLARTRWPNGLAMRGSGTSKTLFWCDSYRQTIESVVLASGERLSHITAKTHDFYINRPYR